MLIDKEYNWRGKTILIAEDEEINYMFLERVLMSANVTLVRAANGQAAIDIASNNPNINLILMDIRMPDIDGLEATEAIKKARPNLPVIAQTCYESEMNLSDYPNVHFDGFVSKPVNINKLLEMIDRLI
jgi:CheY-like chemotaxis protein